MDGEGRRIDELEHGFRRDGLPNLIVGRTAADDIYTRASPFLLLVFVVELVSAFTDGTDWSGLGLAVLAAAVVAIGLFGLVNLARGRAFLVVPHRVSPPELIGFVLIPGICAMVFAGAIAEGFALLALNLALLAAAYVVAGYGFVSILRWTAVRFFAQLAASGSVLVRAVPLLLFFSLVTFFTTEIWQSFTAGGLATYWTAILMFVLLMLVFLSVRLPTMVDEIQKGSDLGTRPLQRRERLNLAAVALISQSLQVVFVSAAVWLFYVVLGALLVSADVRAEWLTHPEHVFWTLDWFGEKVQFTRELLRVSTGVAAFSGLYYAVTIMFDAAYRDQFVDALTEEMQGTFARRAEYLDLLARRDATDPQSSGPTPS